MKKQNRWQETMIWRVAQTIAFLIIIGFLIMEFRPSFSQAAFSLLEPAEPDILTTDQTVTIFLSGFSPATVALVPGDEVTWQNVTTNSVEILSGWPEEQYLPLALFDSNGSRRTKPIGLNPSTREGQETIVTLSPGGSFSQLFPRAGFYRFYIDSSPPSLLLVHVGDRDNDRLPDLAETNDGVYINPNRTGTDPDNPDTDQDGLSDGDEVLGTEAGLNLPNLGANPVRKDIFIEYDWLDDNIDSDSTHSHRPVPEGLARVTLAFSDALVSNPDGSTGITVHHDYGQGNRFREGNLIPDNDGVLAGDIRNGEFVAYKAAYFDSNRLGYFHYVILAHNYGRAGSTSSGLAELRGDDLIISLQNSYANKDFVAATLMHELGHNLGLDHGGDSRCNYKPNYNSIMNYRYEFFGVDDLSCDAEGDGLATNLQYSKGTRLTLNEGRLDEILGVCGTQPIDFNENGIINSPVIPIIYDVNLYDQELDECGGFFTILTDHDDWAAVDLTAILEHEGRRSEPRLIEEASIEELTKTKLDHSTSE